MKNKTIEGIVWTGWGNECKSPQWETPSMYIFPEPMEDGIFICNILKEFAGKKVRLIIEEIDKELICPNCNREVPNRRFIHKNKKGCKWCEK